MDTTGYFDWDRREMLPFIPRTARRVLDIGCARGRFGALIRKRQQATVWGVEPQAEAAAIASGRLDHVLCAEVEAALPDLPRASFDCVVCNDVLEHLVDPYRLLGALRGLLTPDGVVVASLSNVRFFPVLRDLVVRAEWEYTDQGVLDRTHLRFFTHKSIARLFAEQGYRVLRLQGINAPRLLRLVRPLLPRALSDLAYQQFACVAALR